MSTVEIPLSQGKVALIDEADLPIIEGHSWYAVRRDRNIYAYAPVPGDRQARVLMHRLITNAPPEMQVDHRDCNGLNNTRDNLRVTTGIHNLHNSRSHGDSSSRFKGVSFDRFRPKTPWKAQIKPPGCPNKCLGRFATEEAAAIAYDAAASALFGEFANLNFPRSFA